ncbi:MAG: hypothetical protein MZV70_67195 [Desulfobacterales bacterium]|nr:hypothetical protein [Desulfobacterales bacterium]
MRSKHATLKKMEDNFEWYKDGVRAVMKHARPAGSAAAPAEPRSGLEGIVRPGGRRDRARSLPPPWRSRRPSAKPCSTSSSRASRPGLSAIDYLQRHNAGRSGFIPVAALHDTSAGADARPDPARLLLHHVAVQPGFEAIAQALLGNVVLAETLAEAVAIFNQNGKIQTLVTRNGDVVSPKGFLIGGSKDAASGILVKKQELQERCSSQSQVLGAAAGKHPRRSQGPGGRGPPPGHRAAAADRAEKPGARKRDRGGEGPLQGRRGAQDACGGSWRSSSSSRSSCSARRATSTTRSARPTGRWPPSRPTSRPPRPPWPPTRNGSRSSPPSSRSPTRRSSTSSSR